MEPHYNLSAQRRQTIYQFTYQYDRVPTRITVRIRCRFTLRIKANPLLAKPAKDPTMKRLQNIRHARPNHHADA